jgi:hypothetical protein
MKNLAINLLSALLLLSISESVKGQTTADALRYALLDPTGTARFAGAGGAFTALGADYGAISVNPAGAAMYRRSEFVIGTALRFHETQTHIQGSTVNFSERRNNFQLDNLGLVFQRAPRRGKWTTFNTVIGYNRTANYNKKYFYEGNAQGSLINAHYDEAKANDLNPAQFYPFSSGLAFSANAIYDSGSGLTTDFEGNRKAEVFHRQYLSEKGNAGELHFGFAGNYKERVMVGLTLGLPIINYSLSSVYEEEDPNENVEYFNNLNFNETLTTEGVGFNLKLGAIFRASQALRIGAAVHTPSYLSLNDSFKSDMTYAYTDGTGAQSSSATSPDGIFDYKLNTPLRTSVGVAYLVGDRGFISGDFEFVDYAASRFNLTADVNSVENAEAERSLNRALETTMGQAINVKLGGEMVFDDLRLRAGAQILGDPTEAGGDARKIYTAGFGYRSDGFYLDIAYRRLTNASSILAYQSTTNSLIADSKAVNNDFMLTLGFRF